MGWVRGTTVGRGTTATVTLAVFDDDDRRVLAAKSASMSTSYSLRHEESILNDLGDCPNVIPCFGHDVTSGSDGELLYNLLLEYFPRGSLHDNLRRSGGSFPESSARRYAKSMLEGLKFVHGRGYVHCDVKLQNVLLCDDGDVKIADFGLARNTKNEKGNESEACLVRGTPMYMSPESVARKEYEAPMDIWAVGCAVAEMVSGRPPWKMPEGNGDVWALMMRIGFGDEDVEIPDEISEQGKDFLRRCLVRDPEKRWTADMLLDHPFLSESATDNCCCPGELLQSPKSVLHFHPTGDSSLCFSSSGSSEVSLSSATGRIRLLATGHEQPDCWCGSDDDVEWLSVREAERGAPIESLSNKFSDASKLS